MLRDIGPTEPLALDGPIIYVDTSGAVDVAALAANVLSAIG